MLQGMLRWSGGETQSHPAGAIPVHGYVYCAANEARKLAETALTACDAARLCAVLANLDELAGALNSPEQDRQDIRAWHDSLAVRTAAMRAAESSNERAPDTTSVEVYIRKGLMPERRRATA